MVPISLLIINYLFVCLFYLFIYFFLPSNNKQTNNYEVNVANYTQMLNYYELNVVNCSNSRSEDSYVFFRMEFSDEFNCTCWMTYG